MCVLLANCSSRPARQVIVLGVDGMDPGFVEQHWANLPNLDRLRRFGTFSRLATTWPPQSPVAWSTFITGESPDETGIFDFIHRDPRTMQPYLSTDKTVPPRWVMPIGPYRLPLSSSRVIDLRKGRPFWEALRNRGIPVTIMRIPANYPPSKAGNELAGMGVPDLRGTEGTFTYFTDAEDATGGSVAGGEIRKVTVRQGHAEFALEGPPNTMRAGNSPAMLKMVVDVDPELPYIRIGIGDRKLILKRGEWSDWIEEDFVLIPHVASVRGIFRLYAKQVHPNFGLYVSPVNVDPAKPALPLSSPASFSRAIASETGEFGTLGIPEDTAVARQNIFTLDDFIDETKRIEATQRKLLEYSLRHYKSGLLFYYFSTVDQASHMLWGRHQEALLGFYRGVDSAIGEVMRQEPGATIIVMSDHGFTTFDRAVNLNTWLISQGWMALDANGGIDRKQTRAYALGLNGLYVTGDSTALKREIRERLLAFRDPDSGKPVVSAVEVTHPAADNRNAAPDLIVGYAPGYRASWETALGQAPASAIIEDNTDLWIGDHCIDPAFVPAVLIAPRGFIGARPAIGDLAGAIMRLFPANPKNAHQQDRPASEQVSVPARAQGR